MKKVNEHVSYTNMDNASVEGYYYDFKKIRYQYPDEYIFFIVGGRSTGKTYSTLKFCLENNHKFVFVKRNKDDIKTLCAGASKSKKVDVNISPFEAINRDMNINIQCIMLDAEIGLAAAFMCDEENTPIGDPVAYFVALSMVHKVKGFEMSQCDYIIFDEFIPEPWERINRSEGDACTELYKTVSRDREHKGKDPVTMVFLANATRAVCPITSFYEVTDTLVMMDIMNEEIHKMEDRSIVIQRLKASDEFIEKESQSPIYKAMKGTAWADMALGNHFAYDDFTCVQKQSLKGYRPKVKIQYKSKTWYVYESDTDLYMCHSRTFQKIPDYNLNREIEQKRFFYDCELDLRNATIEGRMKYELYTMYDLIVNYRQIFKI